MRTNKLQLLLVTLGITLLLTACASKPTPVAPTPVEAAPTTANPISELQQAQVVRVIDGDTIEVFIGGKTYKVRYIGIDTP